ncbi:MAG: hypothetical protein HQ567_18845 [Candidatus Nealsonbacteria bacterium]|nr:hypothetical protein [Candidatus Nealsonbacteria bacterium]
MTKSKPEPRSPRFGRFGLLSLFLCLFFMQLAFIIVRVAMDVGSDMVTTLLVLPCAAAVGAAIGCLSDNSDWILAGCVLGFLAAAVGLLGVSWINHMDPVWFMQTQAR